ncbi:hypothetical protein SmJEL517_g03110 [Synchytrium microbalum]|uniref:PLAT domain-containing protein n=1 Tax=Synchytrium microbalum TaxID=1806994 RepID=A0A507C3A6_9FUNG|nr:uncharacterized protein SmJEL517_g03110 [Synchytrium microbalum]TPX34142.1 hypothetical protein SmJEL517_g03110 [Synchytrium microbalum]
MTFMIQPEFYGYDAAAAGVIGAITASYIIGFPLMYLRDNANKRDKPSGFTQKLAPTLFQVRISTSKKSTGLPPTSISLELDGSRGSSGLIRLNAPKFGNGWADFLVAAPPVGELVGVRLEVSSQVSWIPDKVTVAEVGSKKMLATFNGANWFSDGPDAQTHVQYLTVAQKSTEELSFRTVFWYTMRDEHSAVSVSYPPAGTNYSRLARWSAIFTALFVQLALIVSLSFDFFERGIPGYGHCFGSTVFALVVGQFITFAFGVLFRRVKHPSLTSSEEEDPLRGSPSAALGVPGARPANLTISSDALNTRASVSSGLMLPSWMLSILWFLMLIISFASAFNALVDGYDIPVYVYAVYVGYFFLSIFLRMAVTEIAYCAFLAWLRTRQNRKSSSSSRSDDMSLETGLLRNAAAPGSGGNKNVLFKDVDSGPGTPKEGIPPTTHEVQTTVKLDVKDFSSPDFLADEEDNEDEDEDHEEDDENKDIL